MGCRVSTSSSYFYLPSEGCCDGSSRSATDSLVMSSILFTGLAGDIGRLRDVLLARVSWSLSNELLLEAETSSSPNLTGNFRAKGGLSKLFRPPSLLLPSNSNSIAFLVGLGAIIFATLLSAFELWSLLPVLPVLDVLLARGRLLFWLILLILLLPILLRLLALALLDSVVDLN